MKTLSCEILQNAYILRLNDMVTRDANLNFLYVGVIFDEGKALFVKGQKSERKVKRPNRFLSFIALIVYIFASY